MKIMYKMFTAGIVGVTTVALILATTTNSASAIPLMQSDQGNKQVGANMGEQLYDGKNIKFGNMTLGFRLGVTVTPMLCLSINGNTSGTPILGSMLERSMNQSEGMMGGQGNQSLVDLGVKMKHSGMIPVCFSTSDAILLRSMMMHGGMMGANLTKGSAGNATTAAAANTTKAAGNATTAAAATNNKGSILDPITGLGQAIANGLKGLGNLLTGNK